MRWLAAREELGATSEGLSAGGDVGDGRTLDGVAARAERSDTGGQTAGVGRPLRGGWLRWVLAREPLPLDEPAPSGSKGTQALAWLVFGREALPSDPPRHAPGRAEGAFSLRWLFARERLDGGIESAAREPRKDHVE